jgi:hypothetical protein
VTVGYLDAKTVTFFKRSTMNAAYSSSTAPQVTENELPGTEDASLEGLRTAEPVVHPPQETRHERDNKPSLQEILQMTSTTMSFISTISTLFDDQEVQNSRFREGKIRYSGRI